MEGKRPWSDDEDDRMMHMLLFGKMRGDVAQALNRSKDSVARRKYKLQREGKWPTS